MGKGDSSGFGILRRCAAQNDEKRRPERSEGPHDEILRDSSVATLPQNDGWVVVTLSVAKSLVMRYFGLRPQYDEMEGCASY